MLRQHRNLRNRDTGATSRTLRIILTGPPGIGKTTVCKKLISLMEEKNASYDGFYTEEIRSQTGARIGFDIVPVRKPGERTILARSVNVIDQLQYSKYKVGKYHVFPNGFEAVALSVLDSDADILIIDEIGKMELFSQKFYKKIVDLFSEFSITRCIIATIPKIETVPSKYASFFQKFYREERCKVITVNSQNRDNLPREIFQSISQCMEEK